MKWIDDAIWTVNIQYLSKHLFCVYPWQTDQDSQSPVMVAMSSSRVLCGGAGMAGLAAIKECKHVGLDPVCYELNSDLG